MPYRKLIWRLTEKTKELYPKKEYPQAIVIDTETTGLDPFHDELLQVSIIDEEGNVLFDSYFKPIRHKEWSKAESVNHISPKMVADAPHINEKAAELYAILSQAHWIIGYNVDFDLRFLMGSDIITDEEYNAFRTEDVMIQFAEIYGEYSVRIINGRNSQQQRRTMIMIGLSMKKLITAWVIAMQLCLCIIKYLAENSSPEQ